MTIKGLMIDPSSNHPIVILRNEERDVFLPIWIGVFEASAIQLELEGIEPERPMTHDLLASTFEALGAKIERIVVSDLKENTFFASIVVHQAGESREIDSRPSDALALALRVGAPVYVSEDVLSRARTAGPSSDATDEERLKEWFEGLGEEDLGKYTM